MNVSGVSWSSRQVWGRWGSLLFVAGWILASISILPVIYGLVDPSGPYLGMESRELFALLAIIGAVFIGLSSYRANKRYRDLREEPEGSLTRPADARPAIVAGRRFVWVFWTIFAGLVGGLFAASLLAPAILPLSDFNRSYVVSMSIIGALTFGGLYAAARVLKS